MPCKKPVDVLFLLKAGEQIEDMKTFVKAFINNADIGRCDPRGNLRANAHGPKTAVPGMGHLRLTPNACPSS